MATPRQDRKTRDRTLVEWKDGEYDALWADIAHRKRRGARLKHLALLGLAAEAAGMTVSAANGRAVLGGELPVAVLAGLMPVGVGPPASPAEAPAEPTASATPKQQAAVQSLIDQFLDAY